MLFASTERARRRDGDRDRTTLTLGRLGQIWLFCRITYCGSIEMFPPPPDPSATEALILLLWSNTVADGDVVTLIFPPPAPCPASVVMVLFCIVKPFIAVLLMLPASATRCSGFDRGTIHGDGIRRIHRYRLRLWPMVPSRRS